MQAHQYEHECQAQITIDKYHHHASRARQIRTALGEQPRRITNISVRLRAALGAILIGAGEYIRDEAVARPKHGVGPDAIAEPVAKAVTV